MDNVKVTYIAGVARSGTSWLGQIFNSSPEIIFKFQPLFAYEFKNRINEDSTKKEFQNLFKDMMKLESDFLDQKDKLNSKDYPIFNKQKNISHLVFKENRYQNVIEPMMRKYENIKLVGIIRNPNGCLNSWMKLPKEFPVGSDPLKEWRYGDCKNKGNEDFFGFYKWKEVANLYLDLKDKWPDRVYVIAYEDLIKNTLDIVKEMFSFCDIEFTKQTEDFLLSCNKKHDESPYSVFKDTNLVMNQWKDELHPYITKEIKADLQGTRLEQFLKE